GLLFPSGARQAVRCGPKSAYGGPCVDLKTAHGALIVDQKVRTVPRGFVVFPRDFGGFRPPLQPTTPHSGGLWRAAGACAIHPLRKKDSQVEGDRSKRAVKRNDQHTPDTLLSGPDGNDGHTRHRNYGPGQTDLSTRRGRWYPLLDRGSALWGG